MSITYDFFKGVLSGFFFAWVLQGIDIIHLHLQDKYFDKIDKIKEKDYKDD